MKHNFIMFCKTYSKDCNRLINMLNFFNRHNVENIPLYISVPENELKMFEKLQNNNIKIITDESYAGSYFASSTKHGFSIGYFNQEVCKLSFWETDLCENYLCIDSDLIFIRDFYISDFMYNKTTPYTVLVMDKDLSIEKHYHNYWTRRQEYIKKIYKYIELVDERYRTCHGMQVMNVKVLKTLKNDFMKSKGLDYKDLIEISPYEFTWYNVWFQKSKIVDEYAVEPFFKTFHMRIEYIISRIKLINRSDLAKAYVGIILNSNWEKTSPFEYKNPSWWSKEAYKILKKL
jgi:hypothetical protein